MEQTPAMTLDQTYGQTHQYQRNLALKAVTGLPKEDVLYAIFADFLALHQKPHFRFTIYPQMSLSWKPENRHDRRVEVPDFGLGSFTLPGTTVPFFKLRCGVEAKRAIETMANLPSAQTMRSAYKIRSHFQALYFQAQDQAKAAYRNHYPLSNDGVWWILLLGPYWTPVKLGPFSEAELGVRALKRSDSAQWLETVKLERARAKSPSELVELYRLGTRESYDRLEELISFTDALAQPFIEVSSFIVYYTDQLLINLRQQLTEAQDQEDREDVSTSEDREDMSTSEDLLGAHGQERRGLRETISRCLCAGG